VQNKLTKRKCLTQFSRRWPPIKLMTLGALLSCGISGCSKLDASIEDLAGVDLTATPADLTPPLDMPIVSSQPPSCVGLAATCGASGTDNCCESTVVTGGSFAMGYDKASDNAYPSPGIATTVSEFHLDRYEITVGRFRKFVLAGQGTKAGAPVNGAGSRTLNGTAGQAGWDATNWDAKLVADTTALKTALKCNSSYQTWTDTALAGSESLPINCITWFEATAFCVWDGGFLPTEAEWQFAASGGSEQRAYPWSKPAADAAIDCSHANYKIDSPSGTYCVNGTTGGVNRVGSESMNGDGKYGQSDLAGNLSEWVLDWYANPGKYPINPCDDCANLTQASFRVFRGGNHSNGAPELRASRRNEESPNLRFTFIGARCARAK